MRATARSLMVLALFAAATAVAGDVWRWKDAQGNVHYSDVPVPGAVRVQRSVNSAYTPAAVAAAAAQAASPSDPLAAAKAQNAAYDQQRQQADAAKAVQQDVAKRRAEQCKQATDRYNSLINSHRVYREEKNGERSYLSSKELDENRVRARQDRDTLCASR